jgi:preprotein translocase subunit YajC
MKIYVLLFCLLATNLPAQSQTQTTTTDAAEKIWEKVFKLGVGHDITVKTMSGSSYHGQISRIADNEFEIAEVDLNQKIRWYYSEVKSVRGDYSSKNIFGKRHNPRNDKIITAGGLGGILLLMLLLIPKT